MEHIVQFGINIDDDSIQKMLVKKASETLIEEIKKELGIGYYSDNVVRKLVEQEVQNQFYQHKDEIIELTAKKLTEKLVRTKQVKEATEKVLNDVGLK